MAENDLLILANDKTPSPSATISPEMSEPIIKGKVTGGPGPDGFTPLASEVARSTDLIQAAVCRWEIGSGWQGALASCLPCAIHIEY